MATTGRRGGIPSAGPLLPLVCMLLVLQRAAASPIERASNRYGMALRRRLQQSESTERDAYISPKIPDRRLRTPDSPKVTAIEDGLKKQFELQGCPDDRFMLMGPRSYTGGFNNMVMSMRGAMVLSRTLNRTFVMPASRNDRYNQYDEFRFRQALDTSMLKAVWPCFIDSDQPWGNNPAPEGLEATGGMGGGRGGGGGYGGGARAGGFGAREGGRSGRMGRRSRRGGRSLLGTKKSKSSYIAKTDFKPPPGSVGSVKPVRSGTIKPGTTIADLAKWGEENDKAPVLQVGGSAWHGMMTVCMLPEEDEQFFRHIVPNDDIRSEVERFSSDRLPRGNYVGVHTRWLEGKCPGRAKDYYMPSVARQIGAMCTNNWKHTHSIAQARGLSPAHYFLASDRQRPQADKDFEKNGVVSYDRGNKKDKYYGAGTHFVKAGTGKVVFEPAVDMFLLVDAELFIGNMLSTFSTNVAAIRGALGRESILAWPLPKVTKSFWECERAHFWCGPATSKWSSQGHTKSKGTC